MKTGYMFGLAAVAVIIIVVAYVLLASGGGNSKLIGTPVDAAQLSQLKAIALNGTLASSIGIGTTLNGGYPNYPMAVNGSALVANGKAGVIYVGADYCPFCAVTRWGLIIALMRFGDFSGLRYMQSSSAAGEIYPNTPTFTFSNSSYSSASVFFDAVEVQDINRNPLGTPNALENGTFTRYDLNNAKLPADVRGGIPFVDMGNRSVENGAMVSPQVLDGKSWSQIISQLSDTSSPVSQAIIGSANMFTAYICRINPNVSATSVCQQGYVKSINSGV